MRPLPIEGASRRLGAPPSWNHEERGICHSLDILERDGVMLSAWQPTPSELKRLNEGQPLWLHIWGERHPVVGLSVGNEE